MSTSTKRTRDDTDPRTDDVDTASKKRKLGSSARAALTHALSALKVLNDSATASPYFDVTSGILTKLMGIREVRD